ncbi:choline transporter-like protein 1 isoform X2 [Ixodes scapularis]|uniref:choline transporter-like protein 1 isoform X2 n=1 Tax=Ixodes scapularis TaxID=6945 RepID=UPI001A9D65B1|nr:choline transporter-like protein 1 isoform X2 [Ixodes scapularis]
MGCCCCGDEGTKVHSVDERKTSVVDVFVEYHGPVKERSCTDTVWLFLFAAFCAGLGYILFVAVRKGQPLRLINGLDNYGNICGIRNDADALPGVPQSGRDMSQLPLLVLEDVLGQRRYCASKCPVGYLTTPFRRCIVENLPISFAGRAINVSSLFFEEAAEDLTMCWRELGYMCLIALGFTLVVLMLMRFFTAAIVWLVLFTISLTCVGGTSYLWFLWYITRRDLSSLPDSEPKKHLNDLQYWLAAACLATIVTAILLLIILVMRKRIQLTAALFTEAGRALTALPLLFLQPLWTLLFLSTVFAAWIVGMLFIVTSGDLTADKTSGLVYLAQDTLLKVAPWYHLLALYWMTQFIVSCQYMVIAGATATWYFTRDKDLGSPICTSGHYLLRYHLGSVLLGSFLVALVKLLRALLKWIEKQLSGRFSSCKVLLKVCQVCLCCFERFLKFLNRNAFILVAIHGYPFCKAAREAFSLLSKNVLRVAAINCVGDFVIFMAKVGVIAGTTLIGYEILKMKNEALHYIWLPLVVGGVFAFLISHCFLSVYEMTIDTLFLCFCEDCQMNDGISRPYFMSTNLMAFVKNSRKASKADVKHHKRA